MLCDAVRHRRRWAHAPVIHAAGHFDHKKRVAWVPISMHTCGSFFYNYGALPGGPSGRRSSAIICWKGQHCMSINVNLYILCPGMSYVPGTSVTYTTEDSI